MPEPCRSMERHDAGRASIRLAKAQPDGRTALPLTHWNCSTGSPRRSRRRAGGMRSGCVHDPLPLDGPTRAAVRDLRVALAAVRRLIAFDTAAEPVNCILTHLGEPTAPLGSPAWDDLLERFRTGRPGRNGHRSPGSIGAIPGERAQRTNTAAHAGGTYGSCRAGTDRAPLPPPAPHPVSRGVSAARPSGYDRDHIRSRVVEFPIRRRLAGREAEALRKHRWNRTGD